ncbi:hypothetical protein D3C78_1719140 [compost metagenome]
MSVKNEHLTNLTIYPQAYLTSLVNFVSFTQANFLLKVFFIKESLMLYLYTQICQRSSIKIQKLKEAALIQ